MSYKLTFKTHVLANREEVWSWITSVEGISKEMSPFLKMTTPKEIKDISSVEISSDKPLFVSVLLLFKILPFDYSKLTILEIDEGSGFIEQSPMKSMKLWRHERRILSREKGCEILDSLEFKPRIFGSLSHLFVKQLFNHRHRMLVKNLGAG